MVVSCCFMGCSTFSVDTVKFYNETVAVVDGEKITRFELINSYNNYGYSYYVSQQGLTEKEAMDKTLDLLINRKLMYNHAKNNAKYALTKYDINEVYKSVIDYMDDSFDSYLTKARVALNYDAIADAEEEEEEETAYLISDYKYEKRAILTTGDVIKYIGDGENKDVITSYALDVDFVENYSSKSTKEIVTKLYAKFIERASQNKYGEENFNLVYDKAIALMSDSLISYEKYLRDENGKAYSSDTVGLIKRLIERVYKSELESAYVTNVQDYYQENYSFSTDKLIKKYVELCESDYASYENSVEDYYSYLQNIGSSNEVVYYKPTTAEGQFGYFYHTLIPLEDDVISEINDLKEDTRYSEDALNIQINAILNSETHQARNEEGVLDEEKTVIEILDEYQDYYYGRGVEKFIEFMFKYTSDTATLTASVPYVMGYVGDETYSGMVTEFTDEGMRLMKNGLTATSKADYIITKYGIHLLYYVGDVEVPISYENKNSACVSLDVGASNNLYYTYINEYTEKTYFDLLFDTVYPDSDDFGYSDYETMLVDSLKKDNVVKYVTRVNATLKGV